MSEALDKIWEETLHALRRDAPALVRGWFHELKPVSLEHGVLRVKTANQAQVAYLQRTCRRALAEAVQAVTGRILAISFEYHEEEIAPNSPDGSGIGSSPSEVREPFNGCALSPDMTFETFVTGPCNRLAHAAAITVSQNPGSVYNPLCLHGGAGLGKTHLLQAIAHAIREHTPLLRVCYTQAERLVEAYMASVEAGVVYRFHYDYGRVSCLIVDEFDRLADRPQTQEAFFHTFNRLREAGAQIVVASRYPPGELPGFETRLITRLQAGLVAPLDPPCQETRIALAHAYARRLGIVLEHDGATVWASTDEPDIRRLQEAIRQFDEARASASVERLPAARLAERPPEETRPASAAAERTDAKHGLP